jgi:molybdopterin-synthase adenylyltransferase
MLPLSHEQRERYRRQLAMPEIGETGQECLRASRVLVIGAGGLGCPALWYLAAAGVGTIGIADHDTVQVSDLQRQLLFAMTDIGRLKTAAARERLGAVNPDVRVEAIDSRLNTGTILSAIDSYHLIIDATDNFPAKFLINDACVIARKPYVHAGVAQCGGQIFTYIPGAGCLRCILPEIPSHVSSAAGHLRGLLGPIAGMMGAIQAIEAIKYIVHKGELLNNWLLKVDMLDLQIQLVPFARDPECPACSASLTTLVPSAYREIT